MKASIEKILNNVSLLILLLMFFLAFVGLVLQSERISQKQIALLQKHRAEVNTVANISPNDATFAMIKFQGIRADMSINIEHLENNLGAINPLEFIFPALKNEKALEILKLSTANFNEAVKAYIASIDESTDTLHTNMLTSHQTLLNHISKMLDETVAYEHSQFLLRELIIYAVIILGVVLFLWTRNRFKLIMRDIHSLYAIESKDYAVKTIEIEAIAARFKKGNVTHDNPAYIDSLTELKNYKGLVHAYNNNKALRENNTLCICVFEIDDFNIIRQRYPQKFIDLVLKKIAFMISLYEQHNDVISRIDENRFAMLLPRSNKEDALQECEKIRESVAETFFKVPQGEKLKITLSGGFIVKPETKSIDASISHTKDILKKAQEKGANKIAQLRDYAERV